MSRIKVDSYVVAGVTDHITPWKGVHKTAQIMGEGDDLRAFEQRPPPEPSQSADQSEGLVHDRDRSIQPGRTHS